MPGDYPIEIAWTNSDAVYFFHPLNLCNNIYKSQTRQLAGQLNTMGNDVRYFLMMYELCVGVSNE